MPLPQNPPTWTAVTTGSKEYSIELNDANLETKAWKLPRYEGCQTKTQVLNQKTAGDVTYGGPAAQKYSRNIYWGNGITGMDDGGEDDTLLNFPQFSYVQTNTYYTINDDDTVTTNRLESRKDNFDERRGFYRAFYEDFPIGSDCKIIINDESIKSNLKDRYNVYFNQGRLQKVVEFGPVNNPEVTFDGTYLTSSNDFRFENVAQQTYFKTIFYNTDLIREFYSGDFNPNSFNTGGGTSILVTRLDSFFQNSINYKLSSSYIGDKRFFATFLESGSDTPIRTIATGSVPVGITSLRTENLAELSTTEIISSSIDSDDALITFNEKIPLNQNYLLNTVLSGYPRPNPPLGYLGSLIISKTDDSNPSLLLNLPKNEHLKDGIGQRGFVILPENLHPHIKKNLTYYLFKAGVPLGIPLPPAPDNEFKQLK